MVGGGRGASTRAEEGRGGSTARRQRSGQARAGGKRAVSPAGDGARRATGVGRYRQGRAAGRCGCGRQGGSKDGRLLLRQVARAPGALRFSALAAPVDSPAFSSGPLPRRHSHSLQRDGSTTGVKQAANAIVQEGAGGVCARASNGGRGVVVEAAARATEGRGGRDGGKGLGCGTGSRADDRGEDALVHVGAQERGLGRGTAGVVDASVSGLGPRGPAQVVPCLAMRTCAGTD